MDFTVNTDLVRQAAVVAGDAHQVFNTTLAGLQEIVADSADTPFVGGYGQTGAYQSGLTRFDNKFREVLGQLVDDETRFGLFLEGLHARLNQNATLYDATEDRNTQRLTAIANQLDGRED
ncbi:MAG: hypothetical protein GEV28_15965 [Actinophytocola sp.]|uniref:hypothetical protein n=1 Tax=Actinophytocola sp. TaxID=1872138 RepID=UPI0013208AE9|nr:hypothetical protein [Actinophytocola sp.]MPZ81806.1 hypothetical protein [Actinophytocola sp.]